MKVYELAKNLGVKSVFLMDKIRKEWNLPIKSHMEALSPEMIEQIQTKFSADKTASEKKATAKTKKTVRKTRSTKKTTTKKASAEKESKPKKTTAKKASTTKKTTTKTTAAKKTTVKKIVTKKIASKTKTDQEEPVVKADSPIPLDSEVTKPKSRIIRRRKEDQKEAVPVDEIKDLDQDSSTNKAIPKVAAKNIRSDLVSVKKSHSLKDIFLDEGKQQEEKKSYDKPVKKSFVEKEVVIKFNPTDFRKREVIFQPKKKRVLVGNFKATQITTPKLHKRVLKVNGEMKIDALCKNMAIKKSALIKKLKKEGVDTAELTVLDFDTIALIVSDFGFEAKNIEQTEQDILNAVTEESSIEQKDLSPKPPVVTIMGHVDHGKTTLLDTIRKTKVVDGEAGGITQHIGAYSVSIDNHPISFIDTPGHEAFTAMRARGAQVTDIAIIVVAATDGVMPQTIESVNHAKAAGIPIIVAITKMDAPGANPDKIKQQMSEQEIVSEEWGGTTSFIPVAALKGEGIKELLEQVNLVAEVQELKCQKKALAQGVVLEARMEKGRGCVASLLVQDGTLHTGDNIIAGHSTGHIRQMKDDNNKLVKEMGPSFPVEIIGLDSLPEAGDTFRIVKNEKALKELISLRKQKQQLKNAPAMLSVEELLEKTFSGKVIKELNIILKTDVRGSLEAIKSSLEKLNSENASNKIIHSGAGAITESDVLLAATVEGVILGFNVRPDSNASKAAREKLIEVKTYSIIYELLDDVKKMMIGMLDPEYVDEELGKAEVREVFHISKLGTVAGSYVTEGKVQRSNFVRLVRDGRLVHDGRIHSLRRFKDDSKEVSSGFECGIVIENFNDLKPKDILEAYTKKEIIRTEI